MQVFTQDQLHARGWSDERIVCSRRESLGQSLPGFVFDDVTFLKALRARNAHRLFLLDTAQDRIAGHTFVCRPNIELLARIVDGTFEDHEMNSDAYLPLEPGRYPLYFSSFVVDQTYRTRRNFRTLSQALIQSLCELAQRGVFFAPLLARGLSAEGQALCEGFGMEVACRHRVKGVIYRLDVRSPSRMPRITRPYYALLEGLRGSGAGRPRSMGEVLVRADVMGAIGLQAGRLPGGAASAAQWQSSRVR
ncbi:MAG: hypothetical protein PHQ14_04120 [Chromatiales bacterium]|jgi:hypothetical protein|nr:hypothetical protein [Chromatiales bacterium]